MSTMLTRVSRTLTKLSVNFRNLNQKMAATPMSHFEAEKKRVLHEKSDSSRKGNIDGHITDLIHYINSLPHYYTTSSCSGRIIVFNECIKKKEGCQWLLVSHETVELKTVVDTLKELEDKKRSEINRESLLGYAYFKFEPCILHVACKCLEDAQKMLHIAVSTGFKNSGLSVSKKNKIIVAVRSTLSLEAPIACNGSLIAPVEYIAHLVQLSNEKLEENFLRIQRFFDKLKEDLTNEQLPFQINNIDTEQEIDSKYEPPLYNISKEQTKLMKNDKEK